jgi:hypothetical protein
VRVYQDLWYVSLGQRKSSLCVDFGIGQCVHGSFSLWIESSVRALIPPLLGSLLILK